MPATTFAGRMDRMERIRADLIRRARGDREDIGEQQTAESGGATHPAGNEQTGSRTKRLPHRLPRLFRRGSESSVPANDVGAEPQIPKSPDVEATGQTMPFPGPNRPNMQQIGGDSTAVDETHPPLYTNMPTPPPQAAFSEVPITPSDASIEARERRRRRHLRSIDQGQRSQKNFLFCIPWAKSMRVRTQLVRCLVSGLFITLLLAVYIALSLSKNIPRGELTIMLLLIILCGAVFFCLSLIRLCILLRRGDHVVPTGSNFRGYYGPGGYAVPRQPIQVVFTQDEEAAGDENKEAVVKPPAYGLWRESVRVDPNGLFWQRNTAAESTPPMPERTGPRPPSYASEDGVSYVVEAVPRSIAPTADVSNPLHPSEVGRIARV